MNQQELTLILESHQKWLNDDEGGERANLSGANLSGADLYCANLYGANLSGADLSGANLSDANLYGANLSGADLYCANLYGANLTRAKLYGANLTGANLTRANLSGANLSDANLSGADLSGALGNSSRIFSMQTAQWTVVIDTETGVMQIGCQNHLIADWREFSDEKITAMDTDALEFWAKWKDHIFNHIKLLGVEL